MHIRESFLQTTHTPAALVDILRSTASQTPYFDIYQNRLKTLPKLVGSEFYANQ